MVRIIRHWSDCAIRGQRISRHGRYFFEPVRKATSTPPRYLLGESTGLWSGSSLQRPELILFHHALIGFKLTLYPVLQDITLDGELPDDFILAVCRTWHRRVETHPATNLKFVICHGRKPAGLSSTNTQKSSFLNATPLSHTRTPVTNKIARRAATGPEKRGFCPPPGTMAK